MFLFAEESKHNKEGRVITAEYDKFFFVAACKCAVLILIISSSKM